MSSSINVENVVVVQPKGMFNDPIMFDIEFECAVAIPSSIRWDVIYVGSATSHDFDQELATVFVGPIEVGMNRFVLRADPPVIAKIPPEDLPLTVVMVKAYYNDQEFIRIGYYVQNTPPDDAGDSPDPMTVERHILTDDTTVHQSQIKWG